MPFDQLSMGGTPFGADAPGQPRIRQMFDRVLDYNARTIRTVVSWTEVERTEGTYQWDRYFNLLVYAAERNLRILPIAIGAPSDHSFPVRLSNGGITCPITQAGYNACGRFVAELLSVFGATGLTRAVEVWNEPNLPKYLHVNSEYKLMLNAALAAV